MRQFQVIEGETVPKKVYNIIKEDLQKRSLSCIPTNIMEILKNNKLTKYYNNILQIYCGVIGAAPPPLTRKEEEKIIEMFQEVERTYRKTINRSNLLLFRCIK